MGIKDLGGRRALCLRKERTTANCIGERRSLLGSGGTFKTVSVKIAKQIAGSSVASRTTKDQTRDH
jgi:hypothetical protein